MAMRLYSHIGKLRYPITGAQFLRNTSYFIWSLAVIFSIVYTFNTLSCHWLIVGGSGCNHDRVIIFLATSKSICKMHTTCLSANPSGTTPIIYIFGSNGRSIFRIAKTSKRIPSQYFFNLGQSQKIWVWSPTCPQSLQHSSVFFLSNLDIMTLHDIQIW